MNIFPSRDSLPVVKYGHTLYHIIGIRPQSRTNPHESQGLYYDLRRTDAAPNSVANYSNVSQHVVTPYIAETPPSAAMLAYRKPKLAVNNIDIIA